MKNIILITKTIDIANYCIYLEEGDVLIKLDDDPFYPTVYRRIGDNSRFLLLDEWLLDSNSDIYIEHKDISDNWKSFL